MLRRCVLRLGGRALSGKGKSASTGAVAKGVGHGKPRKVAARPRARPAVPHTDRTVESTPTSTDAAVLVSVQTLRELQANLAKKGVLRATAMQALSTASSHTHLMQIDCRQGRPRGRRGNSSGRTIVSRTLLESIHAAHKAALSRASRSRTSAKDASPDCALLVVVLTDLAQEEAEVQQVVVQSALEMHSPTTSQLPMLWVMNAEETALFVASSLMQRHTPQLHNDTTTTESSAEKTSVRDDAAPNDADDGTVSAQDVAAETPKPQPECTPATSEGVSGEALKTVLATANAAATRMFAQLTTPSPACDVAETERELWWSGEGGALSATVLRDVFDADLYTELERKLAARPTELHVVAYRLGTHSTVQTSWQSCITRVHELYARLTGQTQSDTATTTTASRGDGARRVFASSLEQAKHSSRSTTTTHPGIILLIHANHLTGDDVEVFAEGLRRCYDELDDEMKESQLLAVQLVSAERMQESALLYLLEQARASTPAVLFSEVYQSLRQVAASQQEQPGSVVTQSAWVAAMLQALLTQREDAMRREFDATVTAMRRQQAGHEELARAAQRVEFKAMMTDAVEEVSLRHEQATAHLVKTLSHLVGQWSAEKFVDGLESVIKEQLKPLERTLDTITKGVQQGQETCVECLESLGELQDTVNASRGALLERLAKSDQEAVERDAKALTAQQRVVREVAKNTVVAVRQTVRKSAEEVSQATEVLVETSVLRSMRALLPPLLTQRPAEVDEARLVRSVESAVERAWRRVMEQRSVRSVQEMRAMQAYERRHWVRARYGVVAPPTPPVTQAEVQQMMVSALRPIQQTLQREVREQVRGETEQAVRAALQKDGAPASTPSTDEQQI